MSTGSRLKSALAATPLIAVYTLLAAMTLLSGVGYLADRWLGTFPLLALAGFVVGTIIGVRESRRNKDRVSD
jgi:F0F1-type ATP synthase assembly protein I